MRLTSDCGMQRKCASSHLRRTDLWLVDGCIFTFTALAAGSFASAFGAALSVVAGNEAGGDGVFDVCEAVHAMGAGVDAADRPGGGPSPEGGGGDCHRSCAALRT
eukprot:ANDGO_07921.mRNA.1 hypothetical protein